MYDNCVSVRVWGGFACFTRPEMKVERVSYPVMTPSAARGVLEAIFWEPQMYYLIDSIRVVKRGQWVSFRRNEVMTKVSLRNAQTWMKSPGKFSPIQAGGGAPDGTQRNMLALEDVEYVVTAELRVSKVGQRAGEIVRKYRDEVERRARKGKCFHRPALGVREFDAHFDWIDDPDSAALENWDEDLGLMLYDVFDPRGRTEGFRWFRDEELEAARRRREERVRTLPKREQRRVLKEPLPRFEGRVLEPRPVFFRAHVRAGRLDCHPDRVEILAQPSQEESSCC